MGLQNLNLRTRSRKWIKSASTDRLYIFIDESGDTGLPQESSSKYFMLNILVCDADGALKIEKHFSRYRYFRNADKEFKRYKSNKDSQGILNELLLHISNIKGVMLFSFYLEKQKYIGPYLNSIQKTERDYNPTRFRNFILRRSLEKIFDYVPVIKEVDGKFRSIEILVDRYLENREDEENLKKYINNNFNLPTIQFINQLDSVYSSHLQVADIVGTLIKDKIEEDNINSLKDFIKIFNIENIDNIKE